MTPRVVRGTHRHGRHGFRPPSATVLLRRLQATRRVPISDPPCVVTRPESHREGLLPARIVTREESRTTEYSGRDNHGCNLRKSHYRLSGMTLGILNHCRNGGGDLIKLVGGKPTNTCDKPLGINAPHL